jgi:hypothetical protein
MNPTFEDWLDLMPLVADLEWRVEDLRFIRAECGGLCPMEALRRELGAKVFTGYTFNGPTSIARALGVERGGVWDVADVADDPNDPRRPALMAALGMKS